jgi:predicted amidohydrolase YtcJ
MLQTTRLFVAGLLAVCALTLSPRAQASGDELVVFVARKIVTMEPGQPEATAVAVRDGLIIDVGSLESIERWVGDQPHRVDRRFAKKVLLPGFIDPHVHPFLAGKLLTFDVAAPEDWNLPSGTVPAIPDRATFIERVTQLNREWSNESSPHIVWGWHRLWHGDFTRSDLDAIAPDKPLILWQRSYHEMIANSAALAWMDLPADEVTEAGHQINLETGHFKERGMAVASRHLAPITESPEKIVEGLQIFRKLVQRGGVTTVADLIAGSTIGIDTEWKNAQANLQGEDVPFRSLFIAAPFAWALELGDRAHAHLEKLRSQGTDQLRWPRAIKTAADGAFISQLMQLSPPGYLDGHQGEWLFPPEHQRPAIESYWQQDYDIYYHVNGDKGLDLVLDIFEELKAEHPRVDYRFSLEHFGVSREDQVSRLADLGASVSINGYYLYLFADAYAKHGLGYSRATQMTRLGSLERAGVRFSMHSDCPMGPIEPLLAVTNAVTRKTIGGEVMAPDQRVSVEAALRAVTIDAAWSLRLDRETGSIAVGKKADFVVLEKNPLEVGPNRIRDIGIWGTVYEGKVFEAP